MSDRSPGASWDAALRHQEDDEDEDPSDKIHLTRQDLERLWSLEAIQVNDPLHSELTVDQERAVRLFHEGLEFRDGRYYAPLLWIHDDVQMEDNYHRALSRDKSLCAKFALKKNAEKKEQFIAGVRDFFTKGYATVLTAEEAMSKDTDGPKRYLSIQPVWKQGGTKCRPVFDASEKTKDGKSINNQLLPGPPILADLVEVLLRFRTRAVALVADIKGMFLAIGLKNCKDSHRFLWRDLDITQPPRHCRLETTTFGFTDSPYKAVACIFVVAEKGRHEFPEAADALDRDRYVDDTLTGRDTVSAAKLLLNELITILERAGFKLGKIASSHPEVLEGLPPEMLAEKGRRTLDSSGLEEHVQSALGISWDPDTDTLLVRFTHRLETLAKETKKTLVSQSAKVYDPLGLVAPVTIQAKKMIRECCARDMDWNTPLPADIKDEFARWRSEMNELAEIRLPRCVLPTTVVDTQIHCFSDASAEAYGACVYFRVTHDDGRVESNLVLAKNRLRPKDQLAKKIPRLELLGCLVAVRLYRYIIRAMPHVTFSKAMFWCDSQIAIHWIRKNPTSLKIFTANRVKEIRETVDPGQFHHLPGELNPSADVISRGCTAKQLAENKQWWNGPEILTWREERWLTDLPGMPSLTEEQAMILREEEKQLQLAVRRTQPQTLWTDIFLRHKGWQRRVRVVALVIRFAKSVMGIGRSEGIQANDRMTIVNSQDRKEALELIIKEVQDRSFPQEKQMLLEKTPNHEWSKDIKMKDLDPRLNDKGLITVGGRLTLSQSFHQDIKHPIILPVNDPFTERAIQHAHETVAHAGVEQTLYQMRMMFWPMGGRRYVKKVLSKCQMCRIKNPKTLVQEMAPLPAERTSMAPPFTYIGVDHAGPYYVTDGQAQHKVYVSLYTCLSTRMTHLELQLGLTTESFIMTFRRMISRRGWPQRIYSDSHRTFKKAEVDLKRRYNDLDWKSIIGNLIPGFQGIEWIFSVPHSPWWGGIYERMVGLMKERMKFAFKSSKLSYPEFETVLCEVESLLNSRPLGVLRMDPGEPMPITPAHLGVNRPLLVIPDATVKNVEDKGVLAKYRHQQALSRAFWRDFSRDYLIELQRRRKWNEVTDLNDLVGQVVLIKEDKLTKKASWPLAFVTEVHIGRDGKVRSCDLRTPGGKCLRRPVQKLALVENFAALNGGKDEALDQNPFAPQQ